MNDTEQLFLVAAVWTVIAAVIARSIPNWPGRIAFFSIAVGLPFWELPYGYYNFQKLCRDEGALKVFEPIAPQKTICVDYPFDTSALAMLKRGFVEVEARDRDGNVGKYLNASAGTSELVRTDHVASEYCVTRAFVRDLPWRIMRSELTVVRGEDKRVVIRHGDFVWFGMWWQAAALPVLGRGGECRHDGLNSVANSLLHGAR